MAIDPYAACPGGTGKKVKFCCPDLVNELEKIERMIEGGQSAACLEHVENLQGKYPDRACLLSFQAMLASSTGSDQKARAAVLTFMDKFPNNPVALAEGAMLMAGGGSSDDVGLTAGAMREAVDLLQRALELSGREIAPSLYSAIQVVGTRLLAEGQILAARGHLMIRLAMQGNQEEEDLKLLARINASPSVPLLLKQDLTLASAPEDALWKVSFGEALDLAHSGRWRAAVQKLEELAAKAGDWPAIWWNAAILKAWLADAPGAIEALRKFAAQPMPLDDAVEAEALAQTLDVGADPLDVLGVEYPIIDVETLQARLAADRRAARVQFDQLMLGDDQPPPKGVYQLLSRPLPETAAGLAVEQIPQVTGQVFLFGKQTDREARAELITYRGEEQQQAQTALEEIAADALGPPLPPVVRGQLSATSHLLSWKAQLPPTESPEALQPLMAAERRDVVSNKWPKLPRAVLDGRSAADAAGDPAYRVRVLAAILVLELSPEPLLESFDFNDLRRQLGLPTADVIEAVEPGEKSIESLPLTRLHRLDPAKLGDEDLLYAFSRAQYTRHARALRKLGPEIVNRPSLDKQVDKASVYGILSQFETDSGRSLEYLSKASEAARAAGKSCARFDLAELALLIGRLDVAAADRVLQHIRAQHMREQGVGQAVMEILVEAGIVSPDGTPVSAGPQSPGIVVPGAATQEPGKIWTPGSESAPSGKKSAIWTPD